MKIIPSNTLTLIFVAVTATSRVTAQPVAMATSAECNDVCPTVEPGMSDTCVSATVGDCNCVYDSDPYCSYGCNGDNWSYRCQRRTPTAAPTKIIGSHFGDGFTQEAQCDDVCPSEEPQGGTPCVPAVFGDCNCVYTDVYCAWTCLSDDEIIGSLAQMCMGGSFQEVENTDTSTDAPAVSPGFVFVEFEQDAQCDAVCPEVEPLIAGACVAADVGTCRCVYETDPFCLYECGGDQWNYMCQSVVQPIPITQDPLCDAVCPETQPESFGTCDTTTVGECQCVYNDPYCSTGCMTDGWVTMCQGEAFTDAPVAASTEAPVKTPVTTEAPVKTPVTTEAPVKTPVTTEAPVKTPVTTEAPVESPVTTNAPVESPVTTNPPVKSPVTTEALVAEPSSNDTTSASSVLSLTVSSVSASTALVSILLAVL